MEHLLSQWELIRSRLKKKNVFLFLDYDGTLTPIAETPDEAVISGEAMDALSFVAKCPNCVIAVVSGRSIVDIRALVPIEGLIYAGNHGLEIQGTAIGSYVFVPEAMHGIIQEIKIKLQEAIVSVPGLFVEDKKWSLSCHYRKVSPEDVALAKAMFKEVVHSFQEDGKIYVVEGKKVLEVRPSVEWDKGKAVLWLLDKYLFGNNFDNNKEVIPVYLGDDATDIDAFKALQDKGITVWVGREPKFPTGYFLKDTTEVIEFLQKLKALLAEKEDA
ncbi:MAG: trehalose-phosphatase [Candidatus Omnitrophota bacterium]